jgi:hypothetical protein
MVRLFSFIFISLLAALSASTPVLAQERLPALEISLRDVNGNAVVGATITIRDRSGQQVFVTTQTDAAGVARIDQVPVDTVRVAVSGSLPTGISLLQEGDDALGMRVWLDAVTVPVALRVEPDGRVVPDPLLMFAQEGIDEASLLNPIPTASLAPTQPAALTPSGVADAPSAVSPVGAPNTAPATPQTGVLRGLLLVLALGCGIGLVLWLERRRT